MSGARTWDEMTDNERQRIQAYWDSHPTGQRIASYATSGGELDRDYAMWLSTLEGVCQQKVCVSYLDLADYTWRDSFDDGLTPRQALDDALAAEGLV